MSIFCDDALLSVLTEALEKGCIISGLIFSNLDPSDSPSFQAPRSIAGLDGAVG